MEHGFQLFKDHAGGSAEQQGQNDLQKRVGQDRDQIRTAGAEGFGNAEGNGKDDEPDGIVQCDYGQEQARKFAFGLILPDHHESRGRRRSGSDSAKRDRRGQRERLRHKKMDADHRQVNDDRRKYRLHDADDRSLAACLS